jgi:hypothetical protein
MHVAAVVDMIRNEADGDMRRAKGSALPRSNHSVSPSLSR